MTNDELISDLYNNLKTLIQNGELTEDHIEALEAKLRLGFRDWPEKFMPALETLSVEEFSHIVKLISCSSAWSCATFFFAHTIHNKKFLDAFLATSDKYSLTQNYLIRLLLYTQGIEGLKVFIKLKHYDRRLNYFASGDEICFLELISWEVAHSKNLHQTDCQLLGILQKLHIDATGGKKQQLICAAALHGLPQTMQLMMGGIHISPDLLYPARHSDIFKSYVRYFLNHQRPFQEALDFFYEVLGCYRFFKTRAYYKKQLEDMTIKMILLYQEKHHSLARLGESYDYLITVAQQYDMKNLYDHILQGLMKISTNDLPELLSAIPHVCCETLITHQSKTFSRFQESEQYDVLLTHMSVIKPEISVMVMPHFLNMAVKNKVKGLAYYQAQLKYHHFFNLSFGQAYTPGYEYMAGSDPYHNPLSDKSLLFLKRSHQDMRRQNPSQTNLMIEILTKIANSQRQMRADIHLTDEGTAYMLEVGQMNITVLADLLLNEGERRKIHQISQCQGDLKQASYAALIEEYQKGLMSWVRKHMLHRRFAALEIVQKYFEYECDNHPLLSNISLCYDSDPEIKNLYDKYEKTCEKVFPLLYSTSHRGQKRKCGYEFK